MNFDKVLPEGKYRNVVKFLCVGCLFFCFAAIVKPGLADRLIPAVLEIVDRGNGEENGIDLDPIIAYSGSNSSFGSSSIYSTKYDFGGGTLGNLVTSDSRVVALNRFLNEYGSPMAPYAEVFVQRADETGLDWRLVTAISGVESGFGRIIPYNSYNAWGWRGGPGGDFSVFVSWEDGISQVTRRLAAGYGTTINPYEMEPIYCPPCGLNPEHAWANGVSRYMGQISDYRSNL